MVQSAIVSRVVTLGASLERARLALRFPDLNLAPPRAGLFLVLCSCPMSDDVPKNETPERVTHKVEIAATAEGVASLDPVLIHLEDQLAPTFRKLDLARLYRISKGESISVPGGYSGSRKAVQLIAEHWYNERVGQKRQTQTIVAMIAVALLATLLGATL